MARRDWLLVIRAQTVRVDAAWSQISQQVQFVGELVDKMCETHAKIVIASPYMSGGSIQNVPWLRRILSVLGNKLLKFFVRGHISTLTGMVRAYDGPFIRSLDLRSTGMDIMPEAVYKAMVMRATISEVPGRLDWGPQLEHGQSRMEINGRGFAVALDYQAFHQHVGSIGGSAAGLERFLYECVAIRQHSYAPWWRSS